MTDGYICRYFSERGTGWVRDQRTGIDTWFHRTDFIPDPAKLVVGTKVRFNIVEYMQKGQQRKKAADIELLLPMPEVPFESIPVVVAPAPVIQSAPEPKLSPVRAIGGQGIVTPTAAKSLATETSARAKFQHSNAKHVATLVDARPRGSQLKPAPTDSSSGE